MPSTVAIAMLVVIVIVLGIDIWLAADDIAGNTYSEILRAWFSRMTWIYYLVAFVVGVLLSHWGPK